MRLELIIWPTLCLALSALTLHAAPTTRLYSPVPYIDFLNTRAGMIYQAIREANPAIDASDTWRLEQGNHAIWIKGREPGSILKGLRLVAVDTATDTSANRAPITLIDTLDGKFEPPMIPVMQNGEAVIVGGDECGSVLYRFNVPQAGDYKIEAKSWGPDEAANSFFISLDGQDDFVWGVPAADKEPEQWTAVKPRGLSAYASLCFPMTWAATSPQSEYRADPNVRHLALNLTKRSIDHLSKRRCQPTQLWFLPDLEAVRLWQTDPETDSDTRDDLLNQIRPYVDAVYDFVQDAGQPPEGRWRDNTPNIQIQSAAILRLAAEMWKYADPAEADKWKQAAAECINRAYHWKLPDGPFGYSYGSGVDAGYFSKDAKYLTRYYMLSGDPKAEKALKDLATLGDNLSAHGQPLSLGSPWWKHCYHEYDRTKNIGVKLAVTPLRLSGKPLYGRALEADIARGLRKPYPDTCDWLIAYYNASQEPFQYESAAIKDATFFSKIENGPVLRAGSLTVAMPWRSWCESTCGAFYATPDAVDAQICSTILTAITRDTARRRVSACYPIAYSVVEMVNPTPDIRAAVMGEDFIASATVFRPALGGPALPAHANQLNDSPWRRQDIYFATADGYAGLLELEALRDNHCSRVALWTRCSVKGLKIKSDTIDVPGLSLRVNSDSPQGELVNLGKVWGPPHAFYPLDLIERVIKKSAENGFKKGETFTATVSAQYDAKKRLTIGHHAVKDDVISADVLRDGVKRATLLFNRSLETRVISLDEKPTRLTQSNNASGISHVIAPANNTITLTPKSLTVLEYAN